MPFPKFPDPFHHGQDSCVVRSLVAASTTATSRDPCGPHLDVGEAPARGRLPRPPSRSRVLGRLKTRTPPRCLPPEPEFQAHRLELRTLDDYVKLYGNRPLKFEPGSKWQYSNYGFILLGRVIEKVSGQSYYDYALDHVYKPAGMTSSGSEPEDQAVSGRSVGFTRMGGGDDHLNTETLRYWGTSAGGGYSTVEDLLRFANALQGNLLLNAQYAETLTTGKVDTPGGGRYAFGFDDRTANGIRCFRHGGGAPGTNGELEICPAAGYVVAVLANMDPPAAGRISQFITNRLPER